MPFWFLNFLKWSSLVWKQHFEPLLRSVHTRRQVAATCRGETSQRQIASCVLEKFCENLCLYNRILSQQHVEKIKSDRICATCWSGKILLQRQRFSQNFPSTHKAICSCDCRREMLLQLVAEPVHTEWSVAATCCCNLSPSVYRPLKHEPRTTHNSLLRFEEGLAL